MTLTGLEECLFAYFLTVDALNVTVDGRFYRREEFVRIFDDRIFYATQLLGGSVAARHPDIAIQFVDKLVGEKALSTVNDQYSGVAHQFDTARYRAVVNRLIASNDMCRRSQGAGPQFWDEAFAACAQA